MLRMRRKRAPRALHVRQAALYYTLIHTYYVKDKRSY